MASTWQASFLCRDCGGTVCVAPITFLLCRPCEKRRTEETKMPAAGPWVNIEDGMPPEHETVLLQVGPYITVGSWRTLIDTPLWDLGGGVWANPNRPDRWARFIPPREELKP
jgi:hypothetical protein